MVSSSIVGFFFLPMVDSVVETIGFRQKKTAEMTYRCLFHLKAVVVLKPAAAHNYLMRIHIYNHHYSRS